MTSFHHVTDHQVRSVLESRNPQHRDPGDVATALMRTMRHVMRDSHDATVPQSAVEARAVHCIEAEDAYKRRDMQTAIEALRAVWSDRPVTRLPTRQMENT